MRTMCAIGIASSPSAPPPSSPICTTINATPAFTAKSSGCIMRGHSPVPLAWIGFKATTAASSPGMDLVGSPVQHNQSNETSDFSIRASDCRTNFSTIGQCLPRALCLSRTHAERTYRSTQVGNKLTLPNGKLLSERATGWETGLASEWHWGTIRSSYFLHPGQSPHCRCHYESELVADPARTPEYRSD